MASNETQNWYVLVERNQDRVDRIVECSGVPEACAHSGNSTGAGLYAELWERLPMGSPEARFDVYRVLNSGAGNETFLAEVQEKSGSATEIRKISTRQFTDPARFQAEGSWGIPVETMNRWMDEHETDLVDYDYEVVPPMNPDSMSREDAAAYYQAKEDEAEMRKANPGNLPELERSMDEELRQTEAEVAHALAAAAGKVSTARDAMTEEEIESEQKFNEEVRRPMAPGEISGDNETPDIEPEAIGLTEEQIENERIAEALEEAAQAGSQASSQASKKK